MDEQDDYDAACWAQQEQDERRRAEDEALAKHHEQLAELRQITREVRADGEVFQKRMTHYGSGRQ